MDELAEARAVLALLEKRERESSLQTIDARVAVLAQRKKIDELLRANPSDPAINRLPDELLVKIVNLSLDEESDYRSFRSQQLADVSCHWKEVILGTPCFWTTIVVQVTTGPLPSIETQLARSCGQALDVIFNESWNGLEPLLLRQKLDIIVHCADRWRSLKFRNLYKGVATIILRTLEHLELPLLRCIDLRALDFGIMALFSAKFPALEHLMFDGRFRAISPHSEGVLPATWFTTLKTLTLQHQDHKPLPLFPVPLHAQSLTRLSLTGDCSYWVLPKDSISCPVLQTLVLCINDPRAFLNAIIAPNLEDVNFFPLPHSKVFSGLANKFARVTHLYFSIDQKVGANIGAAFPEAFPNVHEVRIEPSGNMLVSILTPITGSNKSLLDSWEKLDSLTFSFWYFDLDPFVSWLIRRQELERPKLHVKFTADGTCDGGEDIAITYDALQKYCIVELDDIPCYPLVHFSGSSNSFLQMVTSSFPNLGARTYIYIGHA
ncbi:hypothetical protein ID866_8692 [Astraeus odoratus]|nr:hypothetical protein ID866_8692 [Astraeus odoratus]